MKRMLKKINGNVADLIIIKDGQMTNKRIACRPKDEAKARKEALASFDGNALVKSVKRCAVTIALPWEIVVQYGVIVKEEDPNDDPEEPLEE